MKIRPIKPLPERKPEGPGGISLPTWLLGGDYRAFLDKYRAALVAGSIVAAIIALIGLLYIRHQGSVSKRSGAMFIAASNLYNYVIPEDTGETAPMVASEEEKYQRAGMTFQQLVDTYPTSDLAAPSVFYSGNCRYRLKQYALALESFKQFVARFPKHPLIDQAYLGVGDCQEQLGKFDEALEAYRQVMNRGGALAYEGSLGAARCLLKQSETDQEKWNEAVTILKNLSISKNEYGAKASRGMRKLLIDLASESSQKK